MALGDLSQYFSKVICIKTFVIIKVILAMFAFLSSFFLPSTLLLSLTFPYPLKSNIYKLLLNLHNFIIMFALSIIVSRSTREKKVYTFIIKQWSSKLPRLTHSIIPWSYFVGLRQTLLGEGNSYPVSLLFLVCNKHYHYYVNKVFMLLFIRYLSSSVSSIFKNE
jgi:hypothetical protein